MLGKEKINTLRLDLFFCALGKFGQGILYDGTSAPLGVLSKV